MNTEADDSPSHQNPHLNKRSARGEHADLFQFTRIIWAGRRLITWITCCSIGIAIIWIIIAPRQYQATLTVAPVPGSPNKSLGTGFQANLLKDIGGPSGDDFGTFIDLLHSPSVALRLNKNDALVRSIFPARWDDKRRVWRHSSGIISTPLHLIKLLFGIHEDERPSADQLAQYISQNVLITKVGDSDVREIVFLNSSRSFSSLFLENIFVATDDLIRNDALRRADKYIDYINQKLDVVTTAEYRSALVGILSDQEKTRMMIQAGLPYAATKFGSPVVSANPVTPSTFKIFFFFLIIGMLLGTIAVFVRVWIQDAVENYRETGGARS